MADDVSPDGDAYGSPGPRRGRVHLPSDATTRKSSPQGSSLPAAVPLVAARLIDPTRRSESLVSWAGVGAYGPPARQGAASVVGNLRKLPSETAPGAVVLRQA